MKMGGTCGSAHWGGGFFSQRLPTGSLNIRHHPPSPRSSSSRRSIRVLANQRYTIVRSSHICFALGVVDLVFVLLLVKIKRYGVKIISGGHNYFVGILEQKSVGHREARVATVNPGREGQSEKWNWTSHERSRRFDGDPGNHEESASVEDVATRNDLD
ncbi:hypothetical protein VNO77_23263 [Canavalia gladiata]|uniref:Uncharacterized protein n=1 Tax=Canavalia gladiata TaxID=3824 RepID=A0AAN9QBJ7_CANGL